MIPSTFAHLRRQPDWSRTRRLVAQFEYERDARDRERSVEHVGGAWSPAQHARKEAT